MMKITDKSVGDEQRGFRKGRGCVVQIFTVKILVEKYVENMETWVIKYFFLWPGFVLCIDHKCRGPFKPLGTALSSVTSAAIYYTKAQFQFRIVDL